MTPTQAAADVSRPNVLRMRVRSSLITMLSRLMTEDGRVDRVRAGRLLMVFQGALMDLTAPLLHPDSHGWIALGAVAVAMSTLLFMSWTLPLARIGFCSGLAYPISTMLAVAVLGAASPGTYAPLAGYLTLSFVYIGVTQPARSALTVMPVAMVALVLSYGTLDGSVLTRMLVGFIAWGTTAGLLSWLTARNLDATCELRGAVRVDALTGVANRRDLDRRMGTVVPGDTLVVCDLDHFKRVNDTLGHAGGDRILADFGALLRAELRTLDYCARFGGEEFVLILSGAGRTGHRSVIERLHRSWALMQPDYTFSTGAAVCIPERTTQQTLGLADQALYAAKGAGRNTDRFAEDLSCEQTPVSPMSPITLGRAG